MKKSISFIFIILLLAACRKDKLVTLYTGIHPDPAIPARPPRPMVKTITYTNPNYPLRTVYYYYDTLWRLVVLTSSNGANTYYDTLTYSPTYIHRSGYDDLVLNSNGLAYQDNNSSWYAQRHYGYNPDSNMTNEHSMSGSTDYVYDSNGNMIERHNHTEANPPNYIYYDDYYTYNNHLNTIGNYNTGQYYFGKSSVNLIDRQENSWHFNADPPYGGFILYNYTYNDSGWVNRMEQNQANINATQIDSVTVIYDTTYTHSQVDYTYY